MTTSTLENTDTPLKRTGSFPNNYGKLLPSEYYRQVREWYEVLSMSRSNRTPEQMTWIDNFKFNMEVTQHGVWPHNNQHNDARHDGPSKQNWNFSGGDRNDSRNHEWDQRRGENRKDNGGDRGSYPSNRISRGNSTTRCRVGYDDPDRSPESADSRGDKDYQDYIEYKLQRKELLKFTQE